MNNTYSIDLKKNASGMQKSSSEKEAESNKLNTELTSREKKEVENLKNEDERVRTHENAHKALAGNLSKGTPNYNFKLGPDGKRYAVSGNVHIDSSEVKSDPEATIKKAQKIKAAALAPTDPSAQDLKVSREASRMETKARKELAEEKQEPNKEKNNSLQQKINSSYKIEEYHFNSDVDFTF